MKSAVLAITFIISTSTICRAGFINEIHYDNVGGDVGEFVEIVLEAGEDIADFSVQLYNGFNGSAYDTINSSEFTLGATMNGLRVYTTLGGTFTGPIQNGGPDGLALLENGVVDVSGGVTQFLSYEGTLAATSGKANGLTSIDIGVSETGSTLIGHSLQLNGVGTNYSDFTWSAATTNTSGAFNTSQTAAVPEPSSLALACIAGCAGIAWRRRRSASNASASGEANLTA